MESGKGHSIVEEGAEGGIGTGHAFFSDSTNQSKKTADVA